MAAVAKMVVLVVLVGVAANARTIEEPQALSPASVSDWQPGWLEEAEEPESGLEALLTALPSQLRDTRSAKYLFRVRKADDEDGLRNRRADYLFRTRKAGNYLFRTRKDGDKRQMGYLFRTKKDQKRRGGDAYLFRT